MTRDTGTIGESERWLSVIAGGMLTLSSLRRRDLGVGALFAFGGAALVYRGITGRDGLLDALGGVVREGLAEPGVEAGGPDEALDEVEEASLESFPASDPPSFTPTAGTAPGNDEAGGAEDETGETGDEDPDADRSDS